MSDLTFNQLKAAMIANGIATDAISVIYGKVIIDVGAVLGSDCSSLSQKGVVKFLAKLLDAAIKAQATINQGKILGQRLAAFSSQALPDKQFAVITFTLKTQHELSSVTNIIGGGAGLPAKKSS